MPRRQPGARAAVPADPARIPTKHRIERAALQLFAAKGFDGARLAAIARAADAQQALIHHYFGDKAQLFAATLELPFDPRSVGESAMPASWAE